MLTNNTNILKMEENPKVLTTRGACDLLGVSRWYFETHVKSQLTKLDKVGTRNFFLYDEVAQMKSNSGVLLTGKYNVIA